MPGTTPGIGVREIINRFSSKNPVDQGYIGSHQISCWEMMGSFLKCSDTQKNSTKNLPNSKRSVVSVENFSNNLIKIDGNEKLSNPMKHLRLHQDNQACCLGMYKPPNHPRERLNVDLNKESEEDLKLLRL